MIPDLLETISRALPGAMGSVVGFLLQPEKTWQLAVISIVTGTAASYFLTPYLVRMIPYGETDGAIGALGFGIGLTAKNLIPILVTWAEYRLRLESKARKSRGGENG